MDARRWLARGLFVAVACAVAGLGYVQGLARLPVLGMREAAFGMVTFAGFVAVSGLLLAHRLRADESAPPLDAPVTAVVPTYRDAAVLANSVESLRRSDHPVDVVIVCEPDDKAGIERARELADGDAVSVLVNSRPGSKAGAINDAVARTDAEYLAVFDADQRVPPTFVGEVAGHLRDHDVVQARFLPAPGGVVESLAYYEYLLFNDCFRQPLYALTSFRMATSKTLLFRREAFERVGGYDPEVISEDYDFGLRCYLDGVDVGLVYSATATEEAAHTVSDWWGQRKRWMTGNVQVLWKIARWLPDRPRDPRLYVALGIGVASVGGSLFLLALVPKAIWLLAEGRPALAAAPVAAIYAVAVWARRRDGLPMGPAIVMVPLVLPFFSLITLMAAIDYVVAFDDEWFEVAKGTGEESEGAREGVATDGSAPAEQPGE